jgi:ribosomal protein S12 methylthiotransferase
MKIMFVSLGCDKNLVDTEKMMGILRRDHYELTDDETAADVIIINSCCFIGPAKEESIDTILEMAKQKETGSCKALIVTGCLAQRYREEVLSELPGVDAVVGTTAYDSIASVVAGVLEDSGLKGAGHAAFCDIDRLPPIKGNRIVTTGGHYAYLKIAEGCSKHCTYCVIPNVRGRYRSIPEEDLLAEARELAAQGVKELIVVAQETTVYGLDIYGEKRLHVLLKKLAAIRGIEWVRVEYCYPEELYQELVDTIRDEEKICRYLDIPIQHASDAVLKKMGRRTTQSDLRRIIDWLRQELPGVALRTTLISGFPQETEEDHEELMGFVEEMGFDRLGVFAYSQEEDTPAARLPGQIPEEVKERRRDEIMSLQQDISYERSQGFIGSTMKVMIEGRLPEEDVYVGRTYRDAPDVDGYIFIKSDRPLITGDFVTAKVTGADEYDLTGELTDEPAE